MLYKYLHVDDSFKSSEIPGSLSVIRQGTLKYSSPIAFNDPFDCRPDIDLDALFDSILEKQPVSPSEALQGANPQKHWDGDWLHQQYIPSFGVCCFSRTPNNILMWSHYASHHRGIVAAFQVKTGLHIGNENIRLNLSSMPVKYDCEKPLITRFDREIQNKLILTKAQHWAYEKESRVVLVPQIYSSNLMVEHGVHSYQRHLLKSVIVGLECDPGHVKVIKSEVDAINNLFGLSVAVRRARKVSGKYALEIVDI
jgi:hypothetical protein